MRTARALTVSREGVLSPGGVLSHRGVYLVLGGCVLSPRGVCAWGVPAKGGLSAWGVSVQGGCPGGSCPGTPPPCVQNS